MTSETIPQTRYEQSSVTHKSLVRSGYNDQSDEVTCVPSAEDEREEYRCQIANQELDDEVGAPLQHIQMVEPKPFIRCATLGASVGVATSKDTIKYEDACKTLDRSPVLNSNEGLALYMSLLMKRRDEE
ncbi:Fc.00g075460.m01.CDS01 [Cosmosporella sp. VM-42]